MLRDCQAVTSQNVGKASFLHHDRDSVDLRHHDSEFTTSSISTLDGSLHDSYDDYVFFHTFRYHPGGLHHYIRVRSLGAHAQT